MLNTDMGSSNCTLPNECCAGCSNLDVYADTPPSYPQVATDEKFNQETDQDDEIQFGGVPV